ncbi:uncharacterized protein PAC_11815 [Phialocephala subalpina]|uniref:Uncharacterized protein n=1 Tax=Phialocephala subalpina TaxID=576137 RepID=A0A1L7XA45_9HELO|nr:uncharacterized protein PAC_11815 [Phialocephala subalpina]
MQFFSVISASLLASVALAAPAPAPVLDATIETRSVSEQIDVWQDADFLGLKFTGSAEVGQCKNFPGGFTNNITSGKAKPGFRCTVWVDKDCKGTGFSFNTAGVKDLPDWIDNKSKSWKCVAA